MTDNTLPLSSGTFEIYAKYKDTPNGSVEYPLKLFTLTITPEDSFVQTNPNIWSFIKPFADLTDSSSTNVSQYDSVFNNSGFGSNAFEQLNDFVDYPRKARKAKKAAKGRKNAKKAAETVVPEVVTAQNQHKDTANTVVDEALPSNISSVVDVVTSIDKVTEIASADTVTLANVSSTVDKSVTEDTVIPEKVIDVITDVEAAVPEQVIAPVEAVIKSAEEVAENNVTAANATIIQNQSNYYDNEVVDLKLIYVVIAILLATAAVVAVIVITRKQKVK
jgi:hypothetical protein